MIIQSVERALEILLLFSYSRPFIGITEIAKALNISKATAHNLAHTLEKCGFMDQDPNTKKFRLGVMSLVTGSVASGTLEINQKSAGPANHLADHTQLLCRIGIWSKGRVIVTLNAAPHSRIPFSPLFGPQIPPYCTGLGKVLLAFIDRDERRRYLDQARLRPYTQWTITDRSQLEEELETIRSNGYAVTCQEISPGRAGIATPIFGSAGLLAGAIILSGDMSQVLGERMSSLISDLTKTASQISISMGYEPTDF
jgi:DNA-binding IclR family transcriptional regulator